MRILLSKSGRLKFNHKSLVHIFLNARHLFTVIENPAREPFVEKIGRIAITEVSLGMKNMYIEDKLTPGVFWFFEQYDPKYINILSIIKKCRIFIEENEIDEESYQTWSFSECIVTNGSEKSKHPVKMMLANPDVKFRTDPFLIENFEILKKDTPSIVLLSIPDGIDFDIHYEDEHCPEYVEEKHRIWEIKEE